MKSNINKIDMNEIKWKSIGNQTEFKQKWKSNINKIEM